MSQTRRVIRVMGEVGGATINTISDTLGDTLGDIHQTAFTLLRHH